MKSLYWDAGNSENLKSQEKASGSSAEAAGIHSETIDYSYHLARGRQLRAEAVVNFFARLRTRFHKADAERGCVTGCATSNK